MVTYNGKTLVEGTDYDYILVQGSGLKDVGEYIMILNGRGTFIGSAIKTFRIIKKQDTGKKSIKGVRAGSVTYNGKVRKPVLTLSGKKLTEGTDYKAVWINHSFKNIGIYKGTITGTGSYTGSQNITYKILPKGTAIKKLKKGKGTITVSWIKRSEKMSLRRIGGYQVQAASNKKFTKNKRTVTIKGCKKTVGKIDGLKKGRKYYVRIRTWYGGKGSRVYSAWSKSKAVRTK